MKLNVKDIKLDLKDLKVLEALKQNSKLTTSQISKKINVPITTVHNRIKKLEKLGIISGYTVMLNHDKLGNPILSYILANVNYALPGGGRIKQEEISKRIKQLEGVEEVSLVTGAVDLIIKVRLKSIEHLNEFVIRRLREIEGVDGTQTTIVLNSM